MDNDFYTIIGYAVVWCVKYIFVPIVVGITVKLITGKLFQSQPQKQRKKRP
ncbi:MAG TPA: hypothetical protein GXZ22_06660 [Clostridiaceae bacterium]|nr:hypothetical protein [Clostridiaceae bacterium]